MKISLQTARALALHCQGLDGSWSLPVGKEGAAHIVERLGYVQIDTIHIIQRAHHHVIWSRFPTYEPEMLHDLLAEDRRVFEWWAHAAAYLPMSDFRFYAQRMGDRALWEGQRRWLQENQEVVDRVLARIREEGALGTGDFQAPEGFQGGSWWSGWKPSKRALEVLFNTGDLMVSARRKFERIYDLRERIVPEGVDGSEPDAEARDAFVIRRSVGTLGVLPKGEVAWWRNVKPSEAHLQQSVDAGLITPVEVEGEEGVWYAWTEALATLGELSGSAGEGLLHILSPFDNLIIRRRLMERLFEGFDYRLECYLPQEKRKYGYFSLPILWGDRFIARIDTKADRKSQTLIVRHLIFEPDFDDYDQLLRLLADRLRDFARFNNCDTFAIEHVTPSKLTEPLEAALG